MRIARINTFVALLLAASGLAAANIAKDQASQASRNVYLASGHVRPGALVEGDLMAVGGKISVDHEVKGDATLAGGSVEVLAPVGDDLRVAGGDVNIASAIGGELFATGGNVTLNKAASVGRGASLFGSVVAIEGTVDGPLEVGAQKVVINGVVTGDVALSAAEIELGQSAKIGGALNYTSQVEMRRSPGASVTGAISRNAPMVGRQDGNPKWSWQRHMSFSSPPWVAWGVTFFALLAAAALFLLVFPGFSRRAADAVGAAPWLALLVGLGALVGVPALAGLLFISLLGIPLGILLLALYPGLLLLGYLVGVLFVSRRALAATRPESTASFGAAFGFFALALLLVMLLGRLPFVGALAIALITVFGIGAGVLTLSRRQATGATAGPSPAPGLPSA